MPFNGSGTFQRVRNWVSDATAGIKIRADFHDSEDDNLAAGLSNVICRDGQSVVTANIGWNGKRLVNIGNPVNDQDAVTLAYLTKQAFSVAGNDVQGRIKFIGTESDAPGGSPLGIEFAQADLFFGVRKAITSRAPRFVWNDNAAGTGTDIMVLAEQGFLHLPAAFLGFNTILDQTPTAKWVAMRDGYGGYISHDASGGAFSIVTSSNAPAANGALTWVGRLSIRAADGFAQFQGPVAVSNDSQCMFSSTGTGGSKTWTVSSTAWLQYVQSANTWSFGGTPDVNGIHDLFVSNINVNGNANVANNVVAQGAVTGVTGVLAGTTGQFGLLPSGDFNYLMFYGGNWSLRFTLSTGDYHLFKNGAVWTQWRNDGILIHNFGAQKPGGGSWAATASDARVKTVNSDYTSGLAQVRQLRPVRYTYKGNDTTQVPEGSVPYDNSPNVEAARSGKEYVGFIAQDVEPIMPGMVSQIDGYIDGAPVSDLKTVDNSNLIYAVVNALKELADRVETLEAA